MDTIKSYSSIKRTENNNIINSKNNYKKGKKELSSLNIKLYKDFRLSKLASTSFVTFPEINWV